MISRAGAFLVDGGEVRAISYAARITVNRCLPKDRLIQGSH